MTRLLQWTHPQQPAEPSPVHHQAQGQREFRTLSRQPFQAELIEAIAFGMAAMADALQPTGLGWP
jgi:hypothetical protein